MINNFKGIWTIAHLDLLMWKRTPMAIMAALIPPIGMTLILITMSLAVLQQPVALVVESNGPQAQKMRKLIESDTDAYLNYDFSTNLKAIDAKTADRFLKSQRVAGIITIPADFDEKIIDGKAKVELLLNNVDIDFSDDIRRSVDRSVAQFDAPGLKLEDEEEGSPVINQNNLIEEEPEEFETNPYLVKVQKKDLRQTTVDWFSYQIVSALILLILNVGLMGTSLLSAQDVERKTNRYLMISPIPFWVIITGRLLGGTIASMFALVPALVLCVIFKVISPTLPHLPALGLIFVLTALSASSLGALLGVLFKGSKIIAMAASVVSTYLFLLGGGFTTIAFIPQWLRNLSTIIPTRYAIDGMRQVLFYPTLDGVMLDLAVLGLTVFLSIIIGSFIIRRSWLN
jgi:ABC-2 type transport system permease protein